MGRSEIESWIASTSLESGDDEDSSGGPGWRRENILTDWSGSMLPAQTKLFSSSTKARVQFLKEELLVLAKHGGALHINHRAMHYACSRESPSDLSLSQVMDIFKLLTSTYPRYVDAESREAVEAVGMALVRRDELRGTPQGEPNESKLGVVEQVLGWMAQEVGRIQKRPRYVCPLSLCLAPSGTPASLARPQPRTCSYS